MLHGLRLSHAKYNLRLLSGLHYWTRNCKQLFRLLHRGPA
jgi:hypothetical protein